MAVRLFVGNMPYGATEADLRTHFAAVGAPSQVVIPVDRETGRPRGFAFVEFLDRAIAEQAIERFNQQPFMGRSLSVSEARPREPGGFRPSGGAPGGGGGGGGFGGPRPPMGGGFGPTAAWGGASDPALRDRLRRFPARISVPPRRRAPRARNGGMPRSAAPRVRSRSATPGAWADSTTTRTTSRSRHRRTSTTSPRRRQKKATTKIDCGFAICD